VYDDVREHETYVYTYHPCLLYMIYIHMIYMYDILCSIYHSTGEGNQGEGVTTDKALGAHVSPSSV
jgi:hypothetical protein